MSQLLEKPKQQQQQQRRKPSEIFYEAYKEGIPQCKNSLSRTTITPNGSSVAYCATGLLYHELCGWTPGDDDHGVIEDEMYNAVVPFEDIVIEKTDNSIELLNDTHGWSFKDFGDFFASVGE